MKIGISGYLGYHNFGDEIFLKTWKQVFKEHDVYALNQYTNIKSLDRIIIGGGDLLNTSLFTNAYWRPEFFEVPTYIYGIGVPNMPINIEEIKKYTAFFHKCKKVYVRDSYAKEFIIKYGIYPSPIEIEDIAWNYRLPKYKFNKISNNKLVGISYRFNRNFDWKNLCDIALQVARDDHDILLIPLQPAFDPNWRGKDDGVHYELLKILQANVKNVSVNIIPDCSDVEHRINFIDQCDYYITQRLHGMLISLRLNVPCMVFGDSSKFIKVLEKVNLEESLCDNNYDKILKKYAMLMNNEFNVDINRIKDIETKANKEINEFKSIVLKG